MIRIDLQKIFSMVPREQELEDILGALDVENLYEIHITVKCDADSVQQFKETCELLEVKPLVVQLAEGRVMNDVMTSSAFKGTPSDLRDECTRILIGLETTGWETVRCKVEVPPWHEKAQVAPTEFKPYQYFESHIPVSVGKDEDLGALRVLCKLYNIHMSANAFKLEQQKRTIMLTYRSSEVGAGEFAEQVTKRVAIIREALFDAGAPVVEFAVYDSKRHHDDDWLCEIQSHTPGYIKHYIASRISSYVDFLNTE